jgi:hypothetical protein
VWQVAFSALQDGASACRMAGSSMVEGMGSSLPWAMPRIVLRRILPERVLDSPATTSTSLKHATAPIWSRTDFTRSSASPSAEAPASPQPATIGPAEAISSRPALNARVVNLSRLQPSPSRALAANRPFPVGLQALAALPEAHRVARC